MSQTTVNDHPMTDFTPPPTLTYNNKENPHENPYLIYFPESGGELVQDGEMGGCSWTAHAGIAFATNLDGSHLEKLSQLLSAFPYLEASGIRTKIGALDEEGRLKSSLYCDESRDQGMAAQSKLFEVLEKGLGVDVWTANDADEVKHRHDNRFIYRKPLSLARGETDRSPTFRRHTNTFDNSGIPPSFITAGDRAKRFSPEALASYHSRHVSQPRTKRGVPENRGSNVDDDYQDHDRFSKRRAHNADDGESMGADYTQHPYEQMEGM